MFLVAIKLSDVVARAGFILLGLYLLPVDQAGQFGIITTLVSLFAFAFGFERHIDIQRRTAGENDSVFDRAVTAALHLYAFNYLLMLPVFVILVLMWAKVGPAAAGLAAVIVVGEHLSNQAYQYSLISRRYVPLLVVVALKNLLLVILLLAAILYTGGLKIGFVLEVWAAGAVICTLLFAAMWLKLKQPPLQPEPFRLPQDILNQHRASAVHFGIGIVAILMLQFDRLAVGALLSLDQVGIYFRHTLLVSFAYQAFNIASFNRILPTIFKLAKIRPVQDLQRRVGREYLKSLIAAPVILALAVLADRVTNGVYSARYHLDFLLMAVLLLSFLIRSAADFQGMILNAKMLEKIVLRQQAIACFVGAIVMVTLTWRFGLMGAGIAAVINAGTYLILTWRSVRMLQT